MAILGVSENGALLKGILYYLWCKKGTSVLGNTQLSLFILDFSQRALFVRVSV